MNINEIFRGLRVYGISSFLYNALSILISRYVVVSFQKCGKTWLRLMLAKVIMEQYGIKKINLDLQFMLLFRIKAPRILISHAGSTKEDTSINFQRTFRHKKIILLVRDPRDIVISLFHSARTREKIYSGRDISAFIRDESYGFEKIILFMNKWITDMKSRPDDFLLVRYEDMKHNTASELSRILNFVGINSSNDVISRAVAYGSFENMRKLEMSGAIDDYRMKPGDVKDPMSYRTRKGKVGSHREELSAEDIAYVNSLVKAKLDPLLGYN